MVSCGSAISGPAVIGDIVLALVLIISFIIGMKKGFIGLLVTFLAGILTFVLATLLCSPLAEAIGGLGLREVLENTFSPLFASESLTKPLSELATDKVSDLVASLNLPEFLSGAFEDLLIEKIADSSIPKDQTIQSILTSALTGVALSAIAWIILFIVLSIVFFFLKKFVNVFNKIPLIGGLNKLLGGILSLIIASFVICVVMYLFVLLGSKLPQSAVDYVESTKILGWLYHNNPLAQLITKLFTK